MGGLLFHQANRFYRSIKREIILNIGTSKNTVDLPHSMRIYITYKVVHRPMNTVGWHKIEKFSHSIYFLYYSATLIAMSTKACSQPDGPTCTFPPSPDATVEKSTRTRIALTDFRVRTDGVQGNQVHSITVRGMGIPQTDFQPIPMHH